MLYCGLKMHFNMKKELKKFSVPQQRLQRQFFYALIVQSLGPTVFLVLPTTPILLSPLILPNMGIEYNWQTGWLYTLLGLYPPFDSIGFMLIVTEYKKVIRSKFKEHDMLNFYVFQTRLSYCYPIILTVVSQ
uniref:7TM_GPCR_Srx domain-containing protein n=1 Tax=Caenorhabditis tropicalis TaxID=1561998 RepID=A0A1I7UWT5_9PELO